MASQSLWYYTGLPNKVIDTIEEDLENNFGGELRQSIVGHNPQADEDDRNFIDKLDGPLPKRPFERMN